MSQAKPEESKDKPRARETSRDLLAVSLIVTICSLFLPWFETPTSKIFVFGTYNTITASFHTNEGTAFFCAFLMLLGMSYFERHLFPGIAGAMISIFALVLGENPFLRGFRTPLIYLPCIGGLLLVIFSFFSFFVKETEGVTDYVACPYCGLLNSTSAERCVECGRDIPRELIPTKQEDDLEAEEKKGSG